MAQWRGSVATSLLAQTHWRRSADVIRLGTFKWGISLMSVKRINMSPWSLIRVRMGTRLPISYRRHVCLLNLWRKSLFKSTEYGLYYTIILLIVSTQEILTRFCKVEQLRYNCSPRVSSTSEKLRLVSTLRLSLPRTFYLLQISQFCNGG